MKITKLPPRLAYMCVADTEVIDKNYGYGYRHGYVAGYILITARWKTWSDRSFKGEGHIPTPNTQPEEDIDTALELSRQFSTSTMKLSFDHLLRSVLFGLARVFGMKNVAKRYERYLRLGVIDGIEETQILCLAWYRAAYKKESRWLGARPF